VDESLPRSGGVGRHCHRCSCEWCGRCVCYGVVLWYKRVTDYATVAYSNVGIPIWTNRYCGSSESADTAKALAVDADGDVFVTGTSSGTNGYSDYATIAYSSAGVPLWTNRCHVPGSIFDEASAIAVGINAVFVTGTVADTNYHYAYATVAYSRAGVPLWTNCYQSQGDIDAHATGVAVNGGNVYVTGNWWNGHDYDYATIAYSGAGVTLWTNHYDGPVGYNDLATSVGVDGRGNVFVTGYSTGGASDSDYATIAYSSAGFPLWTNRYNGTGNGGEYPTAVGVAADGKIFVTGSSVGVGTDTDYAMTAYASAGAPLWTNRYSGDGNGQDHAVGLAIDSVGNVIQTGYSFGASNSYGYLTIAYSGEGVPLWTNNYKRAGEFNEHGSCDRC